MTHANLQLGRPADTLQSWADVVHRAEARCDSRSQLAEITGHPEQSLRTWGEGRSPVFETILDACRDYPRPMQIDLLMLLATRMRIRLSVEPLDTADADDGSLTDCCRKVTDQAIHLERMVDEAERDGRIDPAEGANIQNATDEQLGTLKQLALHVITTATRRRA